MFGLWRVIKSIILWSYERGAWQYDALAVLILAFVFLTPNRWFASGAQKSCDKAAIYLDATKLAETVTPQATLKEMLQTYFRQTRDGAVQVKRIEPKVDNKNRVEGYCVWLEENK